MKSYKFLEQVFYRVKNIDETINMLYYNAVSNASIDSKIEKVNTLEEIKHEIITSEVVKEMLQDSLSEKQKLNSWESMNLNHMNELYNLNKSIPISLIKELSKAKIECKSRWLLSYNSCDSSSTVTAFANVVKLIQEIASIRSKDFQVSKYDAVLLVNDNVLNTEKVDNIFTDIGSFFRDIIGDIMEAQSKSKIYDIKDVQKDKQLVLDKSCLNFFDIGEEEVIIENRFHGQSYISVDEIRISRNYESSDYKSGLESMLKAIGKIHYIRNLPKRFQGQPVGQIAGKVMYEAQGFLLSKHLMSSQEFIAFIQPYFKRIFSIRGKAADTKNIALDFNRVQPKLLMSQSDEVTSLAYSMLRYALEKEMINDNLQVKDLPDAWLNGIEFYFKNIDSKIIPKNDFEGFLQDDHWINGNFGHFPCLIISAITASQIYSELRNSNEPIFENVIKGDFSYLLSWLKTNVYNHGAKYSSIELLKKITKQDVNVETYKQYLKNRYLTV